MTPPPIHIFLASSAELLEERDQLEIAIARFNDGLPSDSPRFKLVRWEFHEAQARPRGSQEYYNELLTQFDIFVFIFHGKVGKFSRQEFEAAWAAMVATDRPTIYIYHKSTLIDLEKARPRDVESVKDFMNLLAELQQFPVHYDNLDQLKAHFLDQLKRYLAAMQAVGKPSAKGQKNKDGDKIPHDPPDRNYRLPAIHRLLDAAYDDIDLRRLAQYEFPKVHLSLGAMQGKQLVLSQLLDHCKRHLQLQRLLDIVSEEHPELYAYYGPYW